MFSVSIDESALRRKFSALEKDQLPFALSKALNDTANQIQAAERAAMQAQLDRPTPFTLRGVFVHRGSKRQPDAFVFLRDEATKGTPPVKYLAPLIRGGRRRVKRHERALRAIGVLGQNEMTVVSDDIPLNAYGNLPRSRIVQILSQLKAFSEVGALQNETARSKSRNKGRKQYIVPKPGTVGTRGVYERYGRRKPIKRGPRKGEQGLPRQIRPVLLFVEQSGVGYSKRFQFFEVAGQTFKRNFGRNFNQALRQAVASARK